MPLVVLRVDGVPWVRGPQGRSQRAPVVAAGLWLSRLLAGAESGRVSCVRQDGGCVARAMLTCVCVVLCENVT